MCIDVVSQQHAQQCACCCTHAAARTRVVQCHDQPLRAAQLRHRNRHWQQLQARRPRELAAAIHEQRARVRGDKQVLDRAAAGRAASREGAAGGRVEVQAALQQQLAAQVGHKERVLTQHQQVRGSICVAAVEREACARLC